MYKQIFSTPVPYRLPSDPTLVGTVQPNTPYAPNVAYFLTAPRIYGEEFILVNALFVKKQPTADSDSIIVLNAQSRNIYETGLYSQTLKFDGMTGAFLGYGTFIGNMLEDEIVQSVDGSLWSVAHSGGNLQELDSTTYEIVNSIAPSFWDIPADQIYHGTAHPMVDRARNLIVMSGYPPDVDARYILVNNFSTGALIRRIWVSGPVSQVIQESDRRCFVICANGIMNVVDYTTGEIISTTRSPVSGPHSAFGITYAWDFVLRRLLAFNFVDGADAGEETAPINADGSSPNTITGYYPVPIATNITMPIPLKPPRNGRTVPMLVRAVGDAGEPIPSLHIDATASAQGTISPSPQVTDNSGYARINLTGTGAGTSTVDLAATVA
jgi:Bacterial Ig-like domain (group 1)